MSKARHIQKSAGGFHEQQSLNEKQQQYEAVTDRKKKWAIHSEAVLTLLCQKYFFKWPHENNYMYLKLD